jgi:hypothetical protein
MSYKDITEKNNYLNQAILNKARVDKFLLIITMPLALRNIDVAYGNETVSKIISDKLQMSVWGNVVPSIIVPSVAVPFQGQVPKVTSFSRPAYEPVTVNFNIDSEFYNYYVIWKWLALLNDPTKSVFDASNSSNRVDAGTNTIINPRKPNYIPQYSSQISLQPLNEYNQVLGEFVFTQCFATSLNGINFNYQGSEEISSSFTFDFSQLTFNINT